MIGRPGTASPSRMAAAQRRAYWVSAIAGSSGKFQAITRSPASPKPARSISSGANARAGTPREAATFGDVLVFAVPYGALPELGRDLRDSIKGKVVIDACNPFPQRDGEIAERAREKGAGLMSAELLPGARIVRAFNAIGADRMGRAHEEPGRVGMPIAGDDDEALDIASTLIREIGYEPVRVGGLTMGRYLMPGTPLAGERTPEEIRRIAATLKP